MMLRRSWLYQAVSVLENSLLIPIAAARTREEGNPRKRLNQNCRSRVLLVCDDTVVDELARMTRDDSRTIRAT
jgi:hypothetical protein